MWGSRRLSLNYRLPTRCEGGTSDDSQQRQPEHATSRQANPECRMRCRKCSVRRGDHSADCGKLRIRGKPIRSRITEWTVRVARRAQKKRIDTMSGIDAFQDGSFRRLSPRRCRFNDAQSTSPGPPQTAGTSAKRHTERFRISIRGSLLHDQRATDNLNETFLAARHSCDVPVP